MSVAYVLSKPLHESEKTDTVIRMRKMSNLTDAINIVLKHVESGLDVAFRLQRDPAFKIAGAAIAGNKKIVDDLDSFTTQHGWFNRFCKTATGEIDKLDTHAMELRESPLLKDIQTLEPLKKLTSSVVDTTHFVDYCKELLKTEEIEALILHCEETLFKASPHISRRHLNNATKCTVK